MTLEVRDHLLEEALVVEEVKQEDKDQDMVNKGTNHMATDSKALQWEALTRWACHRRLLRETLAHLESQEVACRLRLAQNQLTLATETAVL